MRTVSSRKERAEGGRWEKYGIIIAEGWGERKRRKGDKGKREGVNLDAQVKLEQNRRILTHFRLPGRMNTQGLTSLKKMKLRHNVHAGLVV